VILRAIGVEGDDVEKEIARQLMQLMLEYGSRLDKIVQSLQEHCPEQEFNKWRLSIGTVMGTMLVEIMNPLVKEHPDLKPRELK